MLLKVADEAGKNITLYGQEKDSATAGLARMNMILHNNPTAEIKQPSIEDQTRIATILSDMDIEIAALETKLVKYKQIKQGMMQELLTGKTRLI